MKFNIIKKVTDPDGNVSYLEIDQSKSASATGSILDTVISVPTTIFHELYGEEDDLSSMYDTICGRFPKSSDEIVLITDRYNRVKKNTLINLGLIASTDKTTASISFDEILGTTYKAYKPSKYFEATDNDAYKLNMTAYSNIKPSYDLTTGKITYSGTAGTKTIQRYIEPNTNQKGLEDLYNNDAKYSPKTLKIVGVLRPSETSYMNLMPASIGYVQSLKDEYVEDVEKNCVNMQETSSNAWFFTSVKDSNGQDGLDRLSNAMSDLVKSLMDGSDTVSTTVASAIASSINYEYFFAKQKNIDEGSRIVPYYTGYFNGARRIGQDFREDIVGKFVDNLYSANEDDKATLLNKLIARLTESSFYELNYKNPTYDLSSDEINLDFNILDFVAYFQSYSLISSIMIFPSSISNKDIIKARMDQWNKDTSSDQNVYYTDIMSSYTSTLGTFISLISVVFIIFASISLIVSSIMTANITYVSVIERTKEIGIIRACGARKSDVGHLFETECLIIGFVAGVLGIAVTLILNIPLSLIVDHLFPGNGLSHIASLNPLHALILIVISIFLSFISGFIPARLGARKDPVIALRGE